MFFSTNSYYIKFIFRSIVILIPSLGMLSGLSLAATIPIFFIVILAHNKTSWYSSLQQIIRDYRLELIFLLWCLFSCFWAINIKSSLIIYSKLICINIIALIIITQRNFQPIVKELLDTSFLIGIGLAALAFLVEYNLEGQLSQIFNKIFHPHKSLIFYLPSLDRGCVFLATTSWIGLYILLKHKYFVLSIILYLTVIYILAISDSTAAYLGFILSSLLVFLYYVIDKIGNNRLKKYFLNFVTSGVIIGSLAMPITAYMINPQKIATKYHNIPESTIHRLFIWHFVAEQIKIKPILGTGFASSRNYTEIENKHVIHNNIEFSLLPLHPHNIILQILLETGLIGFTMFILLLFKWLNKISNMTIKQQSIFSIVPYACFLNYYVVSMISFSVWQIWWVCAALFLVVLTYLLINTKRENYEKTDYLSRSNV